MTRDIRVPVLLSAEEYLALKHIAEETGRSQSGVFRYLLKRELRNHVSSMTGESEDESAEPAHVLPIRGMA